MTTTTEAPDTDTNTVAAAAAASPTNWQPKRLTFHLIVMQCHTMPHSLPVVSSGSPVLSFGSMLSPIDFCLTFNMQQGSPGRISSIVGLRWMVRHGGMCHDTWNVP